MLLDITGQTGKVCFCLFMGGLYKKGMNPGQPPKLLDQVRALMRVRRYAVRTERTYCDWIRRYVKFHGMRSREDLAEGTRKVEAFLERFSKIISGSKKKVLEPFGRFWQKMGVARAGSSTECGERHAGGTPRGHGRRA